MKRSVIFLYEPGQLALLDELLSDAGADGAPPKIVSLDAEVDFALEKRGIPFVSGRTLQDRKTSAAFMRVDALTSALLNDGALSAFRYRSVSLFEPLRLSIHIYFLNLFYYIDIIERFAESDRDAERFIVPVAEVPVSKTSGPLAAEEVNIVPEAVRLVSVKWGIRYEPHSMSSTARSAQSRSQERLFTLKRAMFGTALAVLNALIALRQRRPIRILASDYWRNLAPTLRELPEAEVFLLDRGEAVNAGLKNIWRHKMRFVHIEQFLSRTWKRLALEYAEKCREKWTVERKQITDSVDLSFCDVDFGSTVERILNRLVATALPAIICDIEGTYAMYERIHPNTVLLRASVSGQRHFAILPFVAREVGIPALEVQHGGEYLGPHSATRRHPAYFIATYGPLVTDEFLSLGYAPDRPISVGSPRFDAYVHAIPKAATRGEGSGITILSNTPTANINERYGTYSIEEYFKALGDALRGIPNARFLAASRSMTVGYAFNEEARARGLSGVDYESVGTTPLPVLFQQADIFICSYSTVVYEALLYRLPVILAAFAPAEKVMADFHFSRFEKAGALLIAHTPEELSSMLTKLAADPGARARMSEAGQRFMQEQFSFDGHASERITALVRNWKKRSDPRDGAAYSR